MRVVVLVPRRADLGRRDKLWAFVSARWAAEHPTWGVHEGHDDGPGPFNRAAAINRAALAAGTWDVAVIADSDSFVGTDQVNDAVRRAARSRQIVFAYDVFHYLDRRMSDAILRGYLGAWEPGIEWSMHGTCSSMVVVHRSLWDRVHGFDPGFIGWGMEDVAFSLACQAMGRGMQRIRGPVWHLHHPLQPRSDATTVPNVERMRRYEACNYDPHAMAALIAELRPLTAMSDEMTGYVEVR